MNALEVKAAIGSNHPAGAYIHQQHVVIVTHICLVTARVRQAIVRIVAHPIALCVIAGANAYAGVECAITERRVKTGCLKSTTVFLPIFAPIFLILLAGLTHITALFANILTVAITACVLHIALLLTDLLTVAIKLTCLRLRRHRR